MLIASLIALFLGPLLFHAIEKRRAMLSFVDGFAFVSILGLVLFHNVAEVASLNFFSVFLVLIGFLGPNIIEKKLHSLERHVHLIVLGFALFGLAIHAAADGASLISAEQGSNYLPLAVVIHKIPDGICLWWLLKPHLGKSFAWSAVVLIALATIAGYYGAQELLETVPHGILNYFQAFVAGSILHVVFFRLHVHHSHDADCCEVPTLNSKRLEVLGNIIGMLLLFQALRSDSEEHVANLIHTFFVLLAESAPALIFAYIASAFLYAYLPEAPIRWLKKGNRFQQALKGMLVGLPLPICSCGVLPFYVTLTNRGAPMAAGLAFLIATPELGIDSFLMSFTFFGYEFALIRLLAAAALAVIVAVILAKKKKSLSVINEPENTEERNLLSGVKYAFTELFDKTGPWVLVGLFLAAVADLSLDATSLSLPYQLDVIAMSVIGAVIYVCASGATPIAAIMLAKGLTPGAVIAFLLMGPATNISTYGVLSRLHGIKFAILFMSVASACAIAIGILINVLSSSVDLKFTPEIHSHPEMNFAVILLLLIFLSSILRRGFRTFISEIFK